MIHSVWPDKEVVSVELQKHYKDEAKYLKENWIPSSKRKAKYLNNSLKSKIEAAGYVEPPRWITHLENIKALDKMHDIQPRQDWDNGKTRSIAAYKQDITKWLRQQTKLL